MGWTFPAKGLRLLPPSGTVTPIRRKRAFVTHPEPCVNNPVPPSALREWRRHMSRPRLLLALLGIGLILALAGPFGTADSLGLPARLAYWITVPALTYGLGYLVHVVLGPPIASRLSFLPARAATILATGVTVSASLVLLNLAVFGILPTAVDLVVLLGLTLLVSALIELLPPEVYGAAPREAGPSTPALLSRLPLEKRGALVSLSSEDHYTRIRTTQGEDLVLIRLADAIAEAAPTPGLQVHRSHWIATDHVTGATRDGDRAHLAMRHGPDIPVSRANVPAIREAGFLPR
jgi:hypothetical protein